MPLFSQDLSETDLYQKACGLYYYIWIIFLPRLGGYEIVEEVEELEGGARLAHFVRKYPKHADASVEAEQERLLTS